MIIINRKDINIGANKPTEDFPEKDIENMLPDWIKVDIYNQVLDMQKEMNHREQDGFIVISKEQAYFQKGNETFEILSPPEIRNKSRLILENLEKYKEDLFRLDGNPTPEIRNPYEDDDDMSTKVTKLWLQLQQKRTARDRTRTLVYYYLLGQLIVENGQQHFHTMGLTKNQVKKLVLKGTRTYEIFKRTGKFQIYNTRTISVKVLAEMSENNYYELLNNLIF